MLENKLNWKEELKRTCEILINNGINIQDINTKVTREGKRYFVLLKDIKIEGIDIEQIIKENGLDEEFSIGKYINKLRLAYNGTVGKLTDEEIQWGVNLEILNKKKDNIAPALFKGRKISQFHINFIKKNLDKILSGELNTKEILKLLEQESISKEETIIKDAGSIKRMVEMLLKDRPEELEKYKQIVKRNSGKRNPYKGKIGKPKLGSYHIEEINFKKRIINEYLPKILKGETTFEIIEEELTTSHDTINKIIEDYYSQNNDSEGLEKYQQSKRKNMGVSLENRRKAKEMRQEVAKFKIVSNSEFLLLSQEEQEKQVMMKIRKEKLKEENTKRKSALISEEATNKKIEYIMNYFRGKNDLENNKIYFSDEDIRHMIFRCTSLIGKSAQNLDKKLEVLTSYKEITKQTAYGMIKSFPAIMGYDATRTNKQLDLLENENIIDYIIDTPRGVMMSVNLMYALIQYAKERHQTSDLSKINRNNIFMSNNTLKRLYKISHSEIKDRFPYGDKEQEAEYTISAEDIGRATYNARNKSAEANNILESIVQDKLKGLEK